MKEYIKKFLAENEEYIINLRREFHRVPETAFKEFKTSEIIKRELEKMGVLYEDKIAKTGIKAVINGSFSGKTVLLRADMDALPIKELNELDYKSTHDGVMHACGHDGHMAILLGVIKVLNEIKDKLYGKIIFVFQPAEEATGGAKPMIDTGILENEKVDMAFGLHVEPSYKTGSVALKSGSVMASPDEFDIKIIGKGGHGACREKCIDPIYVSSKLVLNLIDFAKENGSEESPCVISVGEICGGNFYNIIPDFVNIKGTSRAVDFEKRKTLADGIKNICQEVCKEYNAEFELDFRFLYPPLVNDEKATAVMQQAAKENELEIIEIKKPFMGGEDFSYFAEIIPSAYIYIGCRNEEKDCVYPWHSAKFNMDEKCLLNGALMMCFATLLVLEK